MSSTDTYVANAERYAASFDKGDLPMPPAKHTAVVACMDARLNPYGVLGLSEGDSHVIRNAGGVVTDDVKAQIEADTGIRPSFALEAFGDVDADVRQSIARIKASPFVPVKDSIRGFVYEVETGRLREVKE